MTKLKATILKDSVKWHKTLGWLGGTALLIFAISGITHPIMSWTSPKQTAYFPPQVKINANHVKTIPKILEQHNINKAIMVKIVPSENGLVIQVTEHNDEPRRYFDLVSYKELENYDKEHAIWLARYYTGKKDANINSVTFQMEFDNAYPWVNRLLPVYRISFDTEDNLTAFVYTEVNALANLTNDWKTTVQSIFRFMHTWSWLDDFENVRVFLMLMLLICLFGMAATGTALVFLIKNRKILDSKRRIHRFVAYIVWLPLLAFSASGTYHLLQNAYGDNHRGLVLGNTIDIPSNKLSGEISLEKYSKLPLNAISVVKSNKEKLVYRLGIPKGMHGQNINKNMKYDGMVIEKPAIYLDTLTGEEVNVTDKDMAIYYAGKYIGLDKDEIINTRLVTHFGPYYDFRNKRLPVWRIDYNSKLGDKLFIDPATGILVDRLVDKEKYESYSFSFLHKWNFLNPIIGRKARDILIIFILTLSIGLTILGFIILLRKKKAN